MKLNVPNQLTVLRLLMVPVFVIVMMASDALWADIVGLVLFIVASLTDMLDGYFSQGAHHLNVNVFDREKLVAAMEHPELYPNVTIRVSGYAVNFHKLSKAHQLEVLKRTYHGRI